ncbi:conserved hypothetical protein [Streptomyces viridosporus ATCC 14672]|uniref:Uncharacterized protein n=1 Tax=Streptomyces viridosporus (strain ATCC 14672 / DSM 40746 / JCM 4963 / KCTC 9882 / NRRL B-12104 / FH 1290) TaxID=566461 RepID=D6A0S0_STRV1|nr:conserved hypothetical protein [Streptomyces viridosporus ATCC 14672]
MRVIPASSGPVRRPGGPDRRGPLERAADRCRGNALVRRDVAGTARLLGDRVPGTRAAVWNSLPPTGGAHHAT